MKNLRIVFMGTPEFAVSILDHLIENKYNVVAVITAPDKPAGRGRKINESAVKKYALKNKISILQPSNLKDKDFIDELEELNADLQVVVAFRMLPKVVWNMPKFGTFNLHASLLPEYRGAAPIHWAIINGEEKTGVTTFFIDDKIDTGEIILQEETKINISETVGSLHDRLMLLGGNLVAKTIDIISEGKTITKAQPERELKSAPKLNSDNTKINWAKSIDDIYNQIRGLNPFPSAWTNISNNGEVIKCQLYTIEKIYEQHKFDIGSVLSSNKEIKIAVESGFINIKELKLSGKRKMDSKSLLNGYSFNEDAKVV